SGDWMVHSQVQIYDSPLKKFFERASAVSLEKEARFFQRLAHEAAKKGFPFAGFVDAQKNPIIIPSVGRGGVGRDGSMSEYWGWKLGGKPGLLFRRTEGSQVWQRLDEPLLLTPLFLFQGDRLRLL